MNRIITLGLGGSATCIILQGFHFITYIGQIFVRVLKLTSDILFSVHKTSKIRRK